MAQVHIKRKVIQKRQETFHRATPKTTKGKVFSALKTGLGMLGSGLKALGSEKNLDRMARIGEGARRITTAQGYTGYKALPQYKATRRKKR